MNPSSPSFSVIVPACARPAALAECLARLAPGAQTLPAAQYEVIVTDDSPDASVRDLVASRFPWVQWTPGPRRGPAANRNHGATQARADWLAFTDDDCLPDPGWLAAYAAARQAYPAARVLEGRTYADRPRHSQLETAPINENGGYLWSCNFAIEAHLFHSLGGFAENFPYATMEDSDLAERLREQSINFPFVPAAAVCHPWRLSDARLRCARHIPSLLLFLERHPQCLAQHRPKVYLRMLARSFIRDFLPSLAAGRWRELPALWHNTLCSFSLMRAVPKLEKRLHAEGHLPAH
jgi:GT2 family glycosyltransferase